jgi:hypothetical protein
MKLREISAAVAKEYISGSWEAYLLCIVAIDPASDRSLADYISAATEHRNVLIKDLGLLADTHPWSDDLDFACIVLIHGNIDLVFAYVFAVELWASNHLLGLWEVNSISEINLSELERIGDGNTDS